MEFDFITGEILLIDKPQGWTSFDVVNKIRSIIRHHLQIKKIKVGHAGTLDPLATGLLIICTGKMTRQINTMVGLDKEYTGTFVLGATTPTFDLEKPVDQEFETAHITTEDLQRAALKLTGTFEQVPPQFSAKMIAGKRAYQYARKNERVEIKSILITVHNFNLTRIAMPGVDFSITCSKGTYIRALARDFGELLGSGAYLSALRRTKIGSYDLRDAISIEQFEALLA